MALLLLPCVAWGPVRSALAWQQEIDEVGVPLHWPRPQLRWRLAVPIAGWPDGGRAAVARAAATWAAPACTDLTLREAAPGEPAEIEVAGHTQPWLHEAEDAAWTDRDVHHGSGRLRAARIRLNPAYDFRKVPSVPLPSAPTRVDLETLVLHEFGHALGLAHAQRRQSVMYGGILPGAAPKRQLAVDDVEAVCTLHPVVRLRALPPGPAPGPTQATWPWLAAALAAVAGAWVVRRVRRR